MGAGPLGCALVDIVRDNPGAIDLCNALAAGQVATLLNWSSVVSRTGQGLNSQHMEHQASEQIGFALMQRVRSGGDSAGLAGEVASVWRQIEAVLTPILGRRGMTVLFKRSLSVTGKTVPWLAAVNQQSMTEMDLDALRLACAAQSATAVADGATAFFRSFYDLLSSLIGAPLTAQLLSSVSVAPHHDASESPGHEQ